MDALILVLLLIAAAVIAIPLGVSYGIYWLVRRQGYNKRLRLLALVPVLVAGYFVYTAFYPTEEFYREDFREVTGMEFPASGIIAYQSATYPDHFGDYTSVAVVKVDKAFYRRLLGRLPAQGFTPPGPEDPGLLASDGIKDALAGRAIAREYRVEKPRGWVGYVGFLSDQETLVVQRASW
ncbi:MAG: hypothetical protein ICV83_03510 [Cytophagales bacterium]|nr:hypothetical protein [Cytophagales bacterium]